MLVKLASRAADQVFVSVYDAIVMYAGWRGPKCIFAKIHSIMSLCRQICIFHANYRWPEQLQGGFWCLWKSPTNTHFSLATRKSPTCLLACLPWALAIDFISTASNQSGNTHFPLATSCWQMVANYLCLCLSMPVWLGPYKCTFQIIIKHFRWSIIG